MLRCLLNFIVFLGLSAAIFLISKENIFEIYQLTRIAFCVYILESMNYTELYEVYVWGNNASSEIGLTDELVA